MQIKRWILSHLLSHSCYGWKWPFLAKKTSHKIEKIHDSAKTFDILIKYFVQVEPENGKF